MPHSVKKLTPNLVVSNVERSVAFYRDVLGFAVDQTVPDLAPYVFVSLRSGAAEIFLNAPEPAIAEYPAFANRPIGGTLTLFIETKWYGVTEFAFEDPDGYVITFAERDLQVENSRSRKVEK